MARISIPWKTYLHYKKNMTDSDRAIYQAMLDGLLEWKKTIPLPNITTDIDHIYDIYTMLLRDIPMLFHISNSLNITAGPNICYAVPEYVMDERTYQRRFQEVVDFLQNCKGLLSRHGTFNQLQIIHDSVVKHVVYHDTQTSNEHNILGTILDRKAVCESIAKSYKLLCDYNGIPCIVVFGYSDANNQSVRRDGFSVSSTQPEDNHAWNRVKLDGSWYNVDLTFDVTLGDFDDKTVFRYDYFLRSDAVFNREHHPSQGKYLPACPADFNLYRKIDQYVQNLQEAEAVTRSILKSKRNVQAVVFAVDPHCGLTDDRIASAVGTTCILHRRMPSVYTYNDTSQVFCMLLE